MFASQAFFLSLVCLGVFVVRGRSFSYAKVLGSRLLFFVRGGKNSRGDFFFFFCPIEWQEVTKRFLIVRRGVGGGLPRKCLL